MKIWVDRYAQNLWSDVPLKAVMCPPHLTIHSLQTSYREKGCAYVVEAAPWRHLLPPSVPDGSESISDSAGLSHLQSRVQKDETHIVTEWLCSVVFKQVRTSCYAAWMCSVGREYLEGDIRCSSFTEDSVKSSLWWITVIFFNVTLHTWQMWYCYSLKEPVS